MKMVCLFCGREHKKSKPQICSAKAEVMRKYTKGVSKHDCWVLMRAVEVGIINLDGEARMLLRQKRLKGKK